MGKWVVIVILMTSAIARADDFDFGPCLSNRSPHRKIFRDSKHQIRCIHFGGSKAVKYTYNDMDQAITLADDKIEYVPGALIQKQLFGFAYPDGSTFIAGTEDFDTAVLRDSLAGINKVKTLDEQLREYFKSPEAIDEFIIQNTKSIFKNLKPDQLKKFSSLTLHQKLRFWESKLEKTHYDVLDKASDLSDQNAEKLNRILEKSFQSRLSVAQCNPTLALEFQEAVKSNFLQNSFDPPVLGYTFASKTVLSNKLLDEFFDQSIWGIKEEMLKYEDKTEEKNIEKAYLDLENKEKEIGASSVLMWTTIHEIGHLKQYQVFKHTENMDDTLFELIRQMAANDRFMNVPQDLKKILKTQLIEPWIYVLEESAESYYFDSIPCSL